MLDPELDKPIKIIRNAKSRSDTHKDTDKATYIDSTIFIKDCRKIYKLSKNNPSSHKTYCGIDLEFNMNWKLKKRYIAFIQIIFVFDKDTYYDKNTIKPVYILNPLTLSDAHFKLFIKYILCSDVIKIFHGSDSLDYPHIFTDILKGNRRKFMKFINSSVDTRFLCELSKRFMSRLGIQLEIPSRCSLYYAMFTHNVIDRKLFDSLEKVASKIDYNKLWLIDQLKPEQLIYAAYDVYYLYDLLNELTTRMSPQMSQNTMENNIDIISLVNRLYRFHMINRLGISKISLKCKNLFEDYLSQKKITKNGVNDIDQKIMDKKLCVTMYRHNNGDVKSLDTYIEDVFSIDTIRKSILYILRIYRLNNSSSDLEYVDYLINTSNTFKYMKGHESILNLINLVKTDIIKNVIDINCTTNF
jgi:hypothetical protein